MDVGVIIILFLATAIGKSSAVVTVRNCPRDVDTVYVGARPSGTISWQIPTAFSFRGISYQYAHIVDPQSRHEEIVDEGGRSGYHTGEYAVSNGLYEARYIWCDQPLTQEGCSNCCTWCIFRFQIRHGNDPNDPCSPSPCQNGGTCLSLSNAPGNYECRCPVTHTGRYCETRVTDFTPPRLTCPLNVITVTVTQIGQPAAPTRYPDITVTDLPDDDSGRSVQLSYNPPPGTWLPYGTTTVNVMGRDPSGNVGECSFIIDVSVGDTLDLTPGQMNQFMNNYNNLQVNVPMSDGLFVEEMISEPVIYSTNILPDLTQAQKDELDRKYPFLFVPEAIARPQSQQRKRRQTQSRICSSYFPATTMLVTVSGNDPNHPGYVGQLARINNRIQWAFNEECSQSYCSGFDNCQCFKQQRTVSALIYNIQSAASMGMNQVPMQWKQVHIYSCRGGF